MASWRAFIDSAGRLGALAEERLRATDLMILGTVKRDGAARISMCEAYEVDGDLMLGMMPDSTKHHDLLRDDRITLHTVVTDKTGREGEVKIIGRVVDVVDQPRRQAYSDRLFEEIAWRPEEPFGLWAIHVDRAWGIRYGVDDGDPDSRRVLRWPDA